MINRIGSGKVLQKTITEEVKELPIHTVETIKDYLKEGNIIVIHKNSKAKWVTLWYSEEHKSFKGISNFEYGTYNAPNLEQLDIIGFSNMKNNRQQQTPHIDGWWRLIHTPSIDNVAAYTHYKILEEIEALKEF